MMRTRIFLVKNKIPWRRATVWIPKGLAFCNRRPEKITPWYSSDIAVFKDRLCRCSAKASAVRLMYDDLVWSNVNGFSAAARCGWAK